MKVKRLGALLVAALLVVAAVPTLAASDATVGSFVVKLAKARNLAASDAQVAVDSLRGVGVRLPSELNFTKRLTEGDVANLSRAFGLNVTTTTPGNTFSSGQVDRFFSTFEFDLGSGSSSDSYATAGDDDGPPFNPYSKGKGGSKGKKKGHDQTPTEPE